MKYPLLFLILFTANFIFGQQLVGTASIYSDVFVGKKTYSGEVFSHNKVSAAHPWLPMGTKIKVTNLKNNKKTTVTINDRMGKSSGFILDMSKAAASQIGLTQRQGITRVKLEVVKS